MCHHFQQGSSLLSFVWPTHLQLECRDCLGADLRPCLSSEWSCNTRKLHIQCASCPRLFALVHPTSTRAKSLGQEAHWICPPRSTPPASTQQILLVTCNPTLSLIQKAFQLWQSMYCSLPHLSRFPHAFSWHNSGCQFCLSSAHAIVWEVYHYIVLLLCSCVRMYYHIVLLSYSCVIECIIILYHYYVIVSWYCFAIGSAACGKTGESTAWIPVIKSCIAFAWMVQQAVYQEGLIPGPGLWAAAVHIAQWRHCKVPLTSWCRSKAIKENHLPLFCLQVTIHSSRTDVRLAELTPNSVKQLERIQQSWTESQTGVPTASLATTPAVVAGGEDQTSALHSWNLPS